MKKSEKDEAIKEEKTKKEKIKDDKKTKNETKKEVKDEVKKTEKKVEQENSNTPKKSKVKEEKTNDANADEKVQKIIEKAKESGKITYGELATELDDTNPEEIDKVFDAFEDLGVDLNDDLDEPDIEDLEK